MLQWKYRAGNSWEPRAGQTDSVSTGRGLRAQEEFYNCADVQILESNSESEINLVVEATELTTTSMIYSEDTYIESTTVHPTTTPFIMETATMALKTTQVVELTTTVLITTSEVIEATTTFPIETTEASTEHISSSTRKLKDLLSQPDRKPGFRCRRLPVELAAMASQKTGPNEFYGTPVCYLVGRTNLSCKDCYENCITPLKRCPRQDCYCKWFPDL